VSTPEDSQLSEQTNFLPADSSPPSQTTVPIPDPDNPPWGFLQALLTWASSVALLWIIPQLFLLPYLATHYRDTPALTKEILLADKTVVLILVASFLPVHALTLVLVWAVASRFGKFSVLKSLGMSWPRNFGVWKSIGLAVLLLVVSGLIVYKFGGQDTDVERILRSSRAAAVLMAIIATGTAPLVEEIIYRGLLYSALQRLAGPVLGVVVVFSMFAGLHVFQYWPNAGAIAAISLLSLVLTVIRARTGRLLPCYVIHLVFNGIQSVVIIVDPYVKSLYQALHPEAAAGILYSLLTSF
jgi:membrane protease YdiL (CAAX protease family)